MYGAGAAIGYTPAEVDGLSFWELSAAGEGYARANGAGEGKQDITDEEAEALAEWLDEPPPWDEG